MKNIFIYIVIFIFGALSVFTFVEIRKGDNNINQNFNSSNNMTSQKKEPTESLIVSLAIGETVKFKNLSLSLTNVVYETIAPNPMNPSDVGGSGVVNYVTISHDDQSKEIEFSYFGNEESYSKPYVYNDYIIKYLGEDESQDTQRFSIEYNFN